MSKSKIALTIVAALGLVGCGSGGTRVYRVPSGAMVPTYKVGSRIVVKLDAYEAASPHRGDVIVFHPPSGADDAGLASPCGAPHPADAACDQPTAQRSANSFLKRIVAVGGDQIAIADNRVILNGKPVAEPYVNKDSTCASAETICNLRRPITIPQGEVFVLGDNRGASADSRLWGPVPTAWIIGKVIGTP